MNHDCRPKYDTLILCRLLMKLIGHSAMYYYDPKTLIHSTIAARTIEPGEEITIPCKTEANLLAWFKG